MRKYLRFDAFKLALLITLVFTTFKIVNEYGFARLTFLDLVEMKATDSKFITRGKTSPGSEVVIVSADEKSMGAFGQWPWPRKVFADMVQALTDAGVKVIGFDAIFAEKDTYDETCETIFRKITEIDGAEKSSTLLRGLDPVYGCGRNDARFGDVLKKAAPTVLGYFFFSTDEEIKNLDKSVYLSGEGTILRTKIPVVVVDQAFQLPVPRMVGVQTNVPSISSGSDRMGFFNQIPDNDGLYRSVPMFMQFGDNYYPSLSLAILKEALDGNVVVTLGTEKLMEEEGKLSKLMVAGREIPIDEAGRFIVKYYGPGQTFRHISAVDVVEKKVGAKELKDKIVLFGVTTIGVYDIRPTPFESTYPGVEIHANVIENVLKEDYLTRPNTLKAMEVLAMLIAGIGFGLMLSRMKLQFAVPAVLAALAASVYLDYTLLFKNGLHTRTILMYAEVLVLVMGMSVFRYFTEEREKGKIRKVFHTYISKNVADEVLKDMTKLKLGGQKKTLTVFFSDIRGFTSISEKLSPEQLVHQLNEYLTPMTNIIISKHEGTLDKYMGDAIMAIFGAPLDQPDHALRCCNAALDMMDELGVLRAKWRNEGLPELNIGIGINTGEMIVGNMGSHVRFEYTVIGDNVNLGSRLEGTNKEYGTNIIISEATRNLVAGDMITRELDELRVKGKKEPVKIYELRGRGRPDEREMRINELFQAARSLYKEQKWDEAEGAFRKVFELAPGDPPSKRYLDRIAYLRTCTMDSCWDGVWDMKSK